MIAQYPYPNDPGSNWGSAVDVFAPGKSVQAYNVVTSPNGSRSNVLWFWDGTSFASPYVAGVVAQYLQANPTKKQADAETWITSNATYNRVDLSSIPSGTNTANRMLFTNV